MSDAITVIREEERPVVDFPGGATYRTIIGDDTGDGLPIRTGIQTSAPGYRTRVHSHPYVETLTVIAGRGEAWLDGEEGRVALEPGVTVVLPANRPHAFRVVGDQPLVTFGIHTFGKRVVNYKDDPVQRSRLPFPAAPGHTGGDHRSREEPPMPDIRRIDITQPPGVRMSRAVVHGDRVFLAGLTAADTSQDVQGQTRQILERIDHYLGEAGTSKSKLLTANLWIKDMAMFRDMNAVWNEWVDPQNPPCRACVRADLARPEVLVEIMVTAAK